QRQEREAVREAEGKGNVQGTCGTDLQLAGLLEPRRQEVWIELVLALELEARRHDRPEEGRRPQRRQGRSAEVVAWAAEKGKEGGPATETALDSAAFRSKEVSGEPPLIRSCTNH